MTVLELLCIAISFVLAFKFCWLVSQMEKKR